MKRPAFTAERWAAVRALRQGERPIYTLLAVATGMHPDTIKHRALREGWSGPPKPERSASAIDADEALLPAEAAEAAGSTEERLARLTDVILREVEALGFAGRSGRGTPDKARMDAVWSMIRMLEKADEFARERMGGEQAKRDEEMGDVLRRIDARIEELARAYAKELGVGRVGTEGLGGGESERG